MSCDDWDDLTDNYWDDLTDRYWDEQEAMIGEELARRDREKIEDLDPHRTTTYLKNGVPYCYLGHSECYDMHTSERLADDAEEDRRRG